MIDISSPLAAIYSTSTMENHHFSMGVSILQQVATHPVCSLVNYLSGLQQYPGESAAGGVHYGSERDEEMHPCDGPGAVLVSDQPPRPAILH